MSTLSLPEVLPSTSRNPNHVDPVRKTRSLTDIDTVGLPAINSRNRFTRSAGASGTRHVIINVPQGEVISSSNNNAASAESRGTLYVEPSAEQKRKEEERHLVNLLQQYTSVKSSGSRNYNYEDKYPEDKAGEELGPNARFFNVYLDEAEKYDDDMIRGLSGTLDALLVFAALFSAVVTTFVVDTSHALEPKQALITSSLIYEQVQYLRANGNATAMAAITQSQYTPESVTHSDSDVLVNGLFFASLSLSLATALLSVLAKQWLQAYSSVTSGSARDTALIRHLRFMGFEEWKVPQIIGLLPLILHASLAVFIAGLIVFLRALYPSLSWVVVGIAGPAFFVDLVSIILPAIYIRCPYRITVLYTPIKTVILLLELPFKRLRRWHRNMHYQHWWRRLCGALVTASRSVSTTFTSGIRFILTKVFLPTFSASTLKHSELQLVQNNWSCLPVLCDGIVWLHNMSSNVSVRQVAACSLAGKDIDDFLKPHIEKIQLSKLHLTAASAEKELWDPSKMSSSSHRAATKLANLFQEHYLRPDDLLSDWSAAAAGGRTNEVAFLHHVWKVPIDSLAKDDGTALQWAVLRRHFLTTKLLLELGANPDFIPLDNLFRETALTLLCLGELDANTYKIANLLLDAGADVNFRGPDESSWSPLYSASMSRGNDELVKWLIEKGADLDMIGGPKGTALHHASMWDAIDVVQVLLKHGANINLKNAEGKTALGLAINRGASRVEALLREHDAIE